MRPASSYSYRTEPHVGETVAAVRALTLRFLAGVASGPGRPGLVACRVVGVGLGPVASADLCHPADIVQVETDLAVQGVVDADEVAVRTVGVRAALNRAMARRYGLVRRSRPAVSQPWARLREPLTRREISRPAAS